MSTDAARDSTNPCPITPEIPGRVEYEATPLAMSLGPVFAVLERWSEEHLEEIARAREAYSGPLAT